MILVTRTKQTAKATLGALALDAVVLGATLEDPPGEGKGPIPAGTYQLVLSYSERFKALLPEVLGVHGRTGIRLHAGNTSADTTGCILLGRYIVSDGEIGESVIALGRFLTQWREWEGRPLTIEERFV